MEYTQEADERKSILERLATNLGRLLVSLFVPVVTFLVLWRGFIFLRDSEVPQLVTAIVAIIWGVSATADKVAMLNSSPLFYLASFDLLFAVLYLPVLRTRARGHLQQVFAASPRLFLFALLGVIMMFFQLMALRSGLLSYVIAIKRAGMVFSILMGYLFFGERHVGLRLAAAAMMMAGICCILL